MADDRQDNPATSAGPHIPPPEGTAPTPRTLGGVPFEVAGPEFYAKYGGKAILLRPVGGAPKPPAKTDNAPPK